ncbi:MAG: serine hydrolase [Eubacteriales bacterium]
MPVTSTKIIPRAKTPEDVGVSSAAVLEMIKEIDECSAEEHGFLIIRHGKVAAESFKKPYSVDHPHIVYSISKPVTSTAVGFAVNEGLLTLDTKVLDIFPEFRLRKTDEKLEKVTIRHLLTMQSGKLPSLLCNKTKDRWLNHFFDAKWIFEPGENFEYVNENIFLLCAILVKLTGQRVIDYLKPRLWDPLGIEKPYWETNQRGVESGGWGLFLSAESLAKFVLCYLNGGIYEGKQIVPADWAKEAILDHKPVKKDGSKDEKGYGYCFWREGPDDKTYRVDGAFSQIGMVFEKYDAVLISVGGEVDSGKTVRYIFNSFPKGFIDEIPDAAPNDELIKAIAARACKPLPQKARSLTESKIDGKIIRFRPNIILNFLGFPLSVLPIAATYMTKDRAGNINNLKFHFSRDECELTWSEGDETNTVFCGMDGEYREHQIRLASTDYTAFSCAAWQDENNLEVWITPIESIGKRILIFKFSGNKVQMKPATTPNLSIMINSMTNDITNYMKGNILKRIAKMVINLIKITMEPVHKGRLKKI